MLQTVLQGHWSLSLEAGNALAGGDIGSRARVRQGRALKAGGKAVKDGTCWPTGRESKTVEKIAGRNQKNGHKADMWHALQAQRYVEQNQELSSACTVH
jgi:hypothetical protein